MRMIELRNIPEASPADPIYVSVFPNVTAFGKQLNHFALQSEVSLSDFFGQEIN